MYGFLVTVSVALYFSLVELHTNLEVEFFVSFLHFGTKLQHYTFFGIFDTKGFLLWGFWHQRA